MKTCIAQKYDVMFCARHARSRIVNGPAKKTVDAAYGVLVSPHHVFFESLLSISGMSVGNLLPREGIINVLTVFCSVQKLGLSLETCTLCEAVCFWRKISLPTY